MRLNSWQRLGIVLSVVWAVGGGWYARSVHIETAQKVMDLNYQACAELKSQKNDFNFGPCMENATKSYQIQMQGSLGDEALLGLAPIPFAWLLVYALIGGGRWIRRGGFSLK